MFKWTWPGWQRDLSGWGDWLSYYGALLFGLIAPFAIYLSSIITNVGLSSRLGYDTILLKHWPWTATIIFLLFISFLFTLSRIPSRGLMLQKLNVALWRGRGLTVPLSLAACAFYGPLLVLAVANNLGIRLGAQYIVATPLVQSSYSIYLVVLSVAALVRYFFVTAVVQTGITGFSRNLTSDLERLASRGKGYLAVSLPWLAFGKLSLEPDIFEEFRYALEKCFQHDNIRIKVFTLHWNALLAGAREAAKFENKTDTGDIQGALQCEREIRELAKRHLYIVKQPDLMGCVIIDEKLYAVHTLLHKAQQNAHLGDAFISMEIDDESISTEYKRRLQFLAEMYAAKRDSVEIEGDHGLSLDPT